MTAPEPPTPQEPSSPAPPTPPSVRIIRGVRDWLHGHVGLFVVVALGALLALAFLRGVYTVANGESAALLRFGSVVDDAVGPGLHVKLPLGVDTVTRGRTGDVFRLEIQGDLGGANDVVTGDENLIEATLVVQYRIGDLETFLFASESPELLVDQSVRAALVEAIAVVPVDEVLTSAKAGIQQSVRNAAQARLDAYGVGVTLVSANLQSVDPPREAAAAFRVVNDARAKAEQAKNQAEGARERALRLARGEAGKLEQEAHAAAGGRRQQARGAADRFESLLAQYRIAPGQTRADLYHRTVRKVLPRTRMIVLAPGEMPQIDINLVERGAPPTRRTAAPPSFGAHEPDNP